jgi:hypothetical protein
MCVCVCVCVCVFVCVCIKGFGVSTNEAARLQLLGNVLVQTELLGYMLLILIVHHVWM